MDLNIFYVDEDTRKKVYEMFGRNKNEAKKDVIIVQEWMKSQPHLPEIMEDVKIENFLIENKFSIEKTKRKIDKYYTIRSLIPDFFEGSNPKLPKMKQMMEKTYLCPHPQVVEGMYRLYFTKLKIKNQLALHEMALQAYNIAETRLYEDCMVGEVLVLDLINVTLGDVKTITPTLLSRMFTLYDVFSLRMKRLYFVNSPSYFSVVIKILKAILKPKIFQRIQVYPDAEILKEILSMDVLPKDYGGEGLSLDELNEMIIKKLAQYQNRFDVLDNLKVDETLRPEKLDNDEVLGFYGNFKKLDVD